MSLLERLAAALEQLRSLQDDPAWFKANGASQSQMQFVTWIGSHPGCRLKQIASGLGLTAPTVSVGIQRLEKAGLLQRAADERDQRAINLELTPRGQQLYAQSTETHDNSMKLLLERLKPLEQRHLVELLERCLDSAAPVAQKVPLPARQVAQVLPTEAEAVPDIKPAESPRQLDFFGG